VLSNLRFDGGKLHRIARTRYDAADFVAGAYIEVYVRELTPEAQATASKDVEGRSVSLSRAANSSPTEREGVSLV